MNEILQHFGIQNTNAGVCTGPNCWIKGSGTVVDVYSPIDGARLAGVQQGNAADCETIIARASDAFQQWRMVPAPQRGEVVRQLGERLRADREALGKLVTLEMGKIISEGIGEVQEMIDICDFAVGLSRQLHGLTMHSERPEHRMYEQYHPLGPIGVITAFNFPVAVWAWNAALALVCGDPVIWKPSPKTPLTALAVQNIFNEVASANKDIVPDGLCSLIVGDGDPVGECMIQDKRLPLISATGSCRMGHRVAAACAQRMGRSLLELGGNNAVIVMDDADLDLVIPGVVFGAVGTAGQRCTTTRRLIVQRSIADTVVQRLLAAYQQITPGNPLDSKTLLGPVIDLDTIAMYQKALEQVRQLGGEILCGGKILKPQGLENGFYAAPTIVKAISDWPLLQEETFAPILYVVEVDDIAEAIAVNNNVPQGLSSSIFTLNMRHAERFLSAVGSDCGIANVNIGTSGAEIGGAFGGEKETGGGRESGSDAWKVYMRRQTNTINWSNALPLAQGITFDIQE
jgi:aldehyde dehydrogenase (NAD+)